MYIEESKKKVLIGWFHRGTGVLCLCLCLVKDVIVELISFNGENEDTQEG